MTQVTVVGSGTMGRGIAWLSALSGYDTVVYDVENARLDEARSWAENALQTGVEKGKIEEDDGKSSLQRMKWFDSLEEGVSGADVVIEAVPEDLDLKRELFSQIDLFSPTESILASNTSSISITLLAKNVERRDRFIGLHFFNPPHLMKLLEIVVGERTSDATARQAVEFARSLGREPIVVRDSPGFATSRLGVAIGLEAIRMLEEGVASAEDIDKAMELGYRHPMGPLKLTDLVGLDVRLGIAEYLRGQLGERFEPPALLRKLVAEGRLGQKTGAGFYDWPDE